MTEVYCDNSECTYCREFKCRRAAIAIRPVPGNGWGCVAEKKRKAPVNPPVDQEPSQKSKFQDDCITEEENGQLAFKWEE